MQPATTRTTTWMTVGHPCGRIAVVPFPMTTLPRWIRDMVEAVAASAQADLSMVAASSLGVVSGAVGRKGYVVLGDHRFPLHVWLMVIGASGDGKSSVFDALSRPLQTIQRLPPTHAEPEPASLPRTAWERLCDPEEMFDAPEAPTPVRAGEASGPRQALAGTYGSGVSLAGQAAVRRHRD